MATYPQNITMYFFRKGLVKFVKKKFPKKRREIEDLQRSVSLRKTSELKVEVNLKVDLFVLLSL